MAFHVKLRVCRKFRQRIHIPDLGHVQHFKKILIRFSQNSRNKGVRNSGLLRQLLFDFCSPENFRSPMIHQILGEKRGDMMAAISVPVKF